MHIHVHVHVTNTQPYNNYARDEQNISASDIFVLFLSLTAKNNYIKTSHYYRFTCTLACTIACIHVSWLVGIMICSNVVDINNVCNTHTYMYVVLFSTDGL